MTLLNMLTPVTTVSIFFLFIGNCLLGVLESYLIKSLFHKIPNYFLIIVGNYVSAIIGFLLASVLLDHTKLNLIKAYEASNFSPAIAAYTGIAYLATLFIEFPFFYYGIKNKSGTRIKLTEVMLIIFIVHIFSYMATLLSWIVMVGE